MTYAQILGRGFRFEAKARLYRTIFREYSCCGDPTLAQRVAAGLYPEPPGYPENTTAAALAFTAVLDTRSAGPTNRSGVRSGVSVAPAVDVTRGFDRSWIRYGAGIEGSWDVTGRGASSAWASSPCSPIRLGSQPVPFTELVTVGGTEPFAGFLHGRLRDRSAIGAELSWRWPVFAYLDGVAAVGFGNVFDAHLQNFRWDLLRLSAELGVRTAATLGREQLPVRHRHRHRALQPGAPPDLVQPRVRGDLCAVGSGAGPRTRRSIGSSRWSGRCSRAAARDPATSPPPLRSRRTMTATRSSPSPPSPSFPSTGTGRTTSSSDPSRTRSSSRLRTSRGT